jgi:hypothetical protein
MCSSIKSKFFNKVVLFTFLMALVLSPSLLLAQDEACQGSDPTGSSTTCPLDTWVWVLVAGAVILGTITLSKKRKPQNQL